MLRTIITVLAAAAIATCTTSSALEGDTSAFDATDPGGDTIADTVPADTTPPDTMLPDTAVSDTTEPDPGEEPGCEEPPSCPGEPPGASTLSVGCTTDTDCPGGSFCIQETVDVYDGETYVSWLGGTCAWGRDCDPLDPASCPTGTGCADLPGGPLCLERCRSTDLYGEPNDWNCGCRAGYRCDPESEVCLPGCSNDRECCEVWDDADGDGRRIPEEVSFDASCTMTCDGDDLAEYQAAGCMARFDCVGE
jgi:hypothetical protein